MRYTADESRFQEPNYGPDREYPTWAEIKEIALRHLGPAFISMAQEIQKAGPRYGHTAFVGDDLKSLIECTVSDGVVDALSKEFAAAVNRGE